MGQRVKGSAYHRLANFDIIVVGTIRDNLGRKLPVISSILIDRHFEGKRIVVLDILNLNRASYLCAIFVNSRLVHDIVDVVSVLIDTNLVFKRQHITWAEHILDFVSGRYLDALVEHLAETGFKRSVFGNELLTLIFKKYMEIFNKIRQVYR